VFTDSYQTAPKKIWLDVGATEDHLFCARLRPSAIDAAQRVVEELDRIVSRVRRRWPKVEVVIRGDSGFCREDLLVWCENHDCRYVLGVAKNDRLKAAIKDEMQQARQRYEETQSASRVFGDFQYQTRNSWRQAASA
jgi:hypothetical protein